MIANEPRLWPALLLTSEAREYLRVSRATLYRWARVYRLKRLKRKGVVRWVRADLDRVIALATNVLR
jgi:predicted DNA-binding transcriptional regulator AlpA